MNQRILLSSDDECSRETLKVVRVEVAKSQPVFECWWAISVLIAPEDTADGYGAAPVTQEGALVENPIGAYNAVNRGERQVFNCMLRANLKLNSRSRLDKIAATKVTRLPPAESPNNAKD